MVGGGALCSEMLGRLYPQMTCLIDLAMVRFTATCGGTVMEGHTRLYDAAVVLRHTTGELLAKLGSPHVAPGRVSLPMHIVSELILQLLPQLEQKAALAEVRRLRIHNPLAVSLMP